MATKLDSPTRPVNPPAAPEPGARWYERGLPRLYGLQAKLILPYGVLTLILAMVGTYVVTQLATSTIRERFGNQLADAGNVARDGVVRRERAHLEDLRQIAFTIGVPDAVAAGDVARLQEFIVPLALNSSLDFVSVTDANGRGQLNLVRDPISGQYQVNQGDDLSQFEPVLKVLRGEQDSQGDKFVDFWRGASDSYLLTAAAVRLSTPDQPIVGAVVVGTRARRLAEELAQQSLAEIILLDPQGRLLATTFPEPDEGFGILELSDPALASQTPPHSPELRLYERDYEIQYVPLVARGGTAALGILGSGLQSDFVTVSESTSRDSLAVIFTVGTAAVIIIGFLLSRIIAQPILHLRDMSQNVASGDLDQRSGLVQNDEIGELASAFDVMTGRLRERTAEAKRLYEETVQRNRELNEANQKLQMAQAQLVQSEKLAAIGQLTAGIVHDVKNPLAVIKGLAEILQDDPVVEGENRRFVDEIRDNSVRANRIVTDLLKFARQSTPEMLSRDLRETIDTAVRLTEYLTRKARVTAHVHMPETALIVTYDAQQIEQVLINLIHNALHAMPEGGELHLGLSPADGQAVITVRDTGTGISPEHLHHIFDPFFTTKPEGEGTGLGLSVSYGIVSRHRGQISVESQLGRGTTFTILLPMDAMQPGA